MVKMVIEFEELARKYGKRNVVGYMSAVIEAKYIDHSNKGKKEEKLDAACCLIDCLAYGSRELDYQTEEKTLRDRLEKIVEKHELTKCLIQLCEALHRMSEEDGDDRALWLANGLTSILQLGDYI